MPRIPILIAIFGFLVAPSIGAAKTVTVTVTGCHFEQQCEVAEPALPRIEAGDEVTVRVESFNFLFYRPSIDVEVTAVESYQFLEHLWSQLLGVEAELAPSGRTGGTCSDFQECAVDWLVAIRTSSKNLSDTLDKFRAKVELVAQEVEEISSIKGDVLANATNLETQKTRALDQVRTLEDLRQFEIIESRHEDAIAAINAFSMAATLVESGTSLRIAPQKAGNSVSAVLSVESAPRASARTRTQRISYFVHSSLGLTYHIGYAHTDADDFEFEKVRALDGRDLFAEVKSEQGVDDLVAFLSYPLNTWGKEERHGLYATLGTGLDEIGEHIYAGISAKFYKRWFLTAGVSSVETTTAEGSVMEMNGQRELFEILQNDREWEVFYAISVRIF